MENTKSRFAPRVLLVVAVLALLAAYGPHLGHSTDDAFITYRYARNLARGNGMTFNPGERHLATTAPGWAMLLAPFGLLPGSSAIPLASGILSLLCLVGAVWLLARGLLPENPWLPSFALLLVAACRWLVEVLGHEGFAQMLLILLAVAALERRRWAAGGVAFAAATAVRPDAGVVGAVEGLVEWWRTRRFPARLLLAYAGALLPFALLLWLTAGTVVPSSLDSKLTEASLPRLAVLPGYGSRLLTWLWRDFGWGWPLLLAGAGAGLVMLWRSDRARTLRLLLPAMVLGLFYPCLGINFAPWYLVLPLTTLLVLAAVPAAKLLAARRFGIALVAVSIVVAAMAPSIAWLTGHGGVPPDARQAPRAKLAKWIDAHSGPGDRVAAVEIGFLGYDSDRPILDLIGLGSPGVLEAIRRGELVDTFFAAAPKFLVRNTAFDYLLNPIIHDQRFAAGYELALTVPPDGRHLTPVLLYRRRSQPPPAVASSRRLRAMSTRLRR